MTEAAASPDVTIDSVLASRWQEVLATAAEKECFAYAWAFEAARICAVKDGDHARATALGLLAHVCMLVLSNDDKKAPGPAAVVDALAAAQLGVIAAFAGHVTDPEWSARINDILWLRRKDRHAAEVAVRAYLQSAEHHSGPKTWLTGYARTKRALALAASLGKKNCLYAEVLAAIETDLVRLDAGDPLCFSAPLMRLQLEHRAGDAAVGAARANRLAEAAERDRDWWRASTFYELAGDWCKRNDDTEGARRAWISAAEAFVSVAAVRADAEPYAAAMNLQEAIKAYRRIGKSQTRVDQLLELMEEHQRRAAEGFATFGTSFDFAQEIQQAVDMVRGKASVLDALFALATATRSPSKSEMLDTVRNRATLSPIARTFVDSKTGRVTGLQPPAPSGIGDEALETATFECAKCKQHLIASFLEPARLLIFKEHPVRDHDLLPLVRGSPFVPPGREERFARGLAAGLRGDRLVAAALLIPQIESSLRFIVEQRGGQAYSLGDDGIQDAHGLEHLLGLPLVKQVLGENIVFDLRGLLIERSGWNLRHLEAHGLIDDADFNSTTVAYFWWLTLRLVVVFALAATRPI